MKIRGVALHLLFSFVLLMVTTGIPAALCFHWFASGQETDAISSASIQIPEKPSGECVLLINRPLHADSMKDWEAFFRDGELNVIFDDISCMIPAGDITAKEMAQRFQAQLPENQMQLRTENLTLLLSKAENGCIDAALFSKEIAQAMGLSVTEQNGKITVINILGGTDDNEKA